MLVFHGSMRVSPGTRADFVKELLDAGVVERFRSEQGNVFYTLALSAEDDDVVVTCDAWETKQDFEAHTKSEACVQFMRLHDRYVIADAEPFVFES